MKDEEKLVVILISSFLIMIFLLPFVMVFLFPNKYIDPEGLTKLAMGILMLEFGGFTMYSGWKKTIELSKKCKSKREFLKAMFGIAPKEK